MSTQTVTDAVAKRDGITNFLAPYRADFGAVLPTHMDSEQWIRLTTGTLRRNAQLARVATSNPSSLIAAMFDCARLGLVIGDTYHLVPFGNEIVGIADYTGLIELVYRAGAVSSVKCEVVKSRDEFAYEPGIMDRPQHKPDWFGERGDIIGAYAYAVMKDGATSHVVVRSKAEIDEVRAVSKTANAKDSMWVKWYDRAARKTVLRELMKFIPTSAEYRKEVARAAAEATRVADSHQLPPPVNDFVDGEVVEQDWPEAAQPPDGTS